MANSIPNTSGASFAPSEQTSGLEIDTAQKGKTGEGTNPAASYYAPPIDRAAQYGPLTEPVRGQADSGLVDGAGAWVKSNILPTGHDGAGTAGPTAQAGHWPINGKGAHQLSFGSDFLSK